MAGKDLKFTVTGDTKGAVKSLGDVEKAAEDAGTALEETQTPAQQLATAIKAAADAAKAELEGTQSAADALRVHLGDAGSDVNLDEAVSKFRQLGLTFDEIKADADTLAAAIKHADDVTRSVDASGVRAVGDTARTTRTDLDNMNVSGDQSRSVLANLAGNTAQDLGEIGGAVGTLGVGVGQLAEYAVDGNIKMSQLAKVAGPMLGLAAAGLAVQHVMGQIAESKAFHKENVEGFTESIKEGEDAAAALRDRLREAGEVKFDKGGIMGGTADATDAIIGAGLSMEQFTRFATGSKEELERLEDTMMSSTDTAGSLAFGMSAQGVTVNAAKQYWSDYQKALKEAEEIAKAFPLTQDQVNNALDKFIEKKDPVSKFPEEFERIATALKSGAKPAVADVDAVMQGLNISMEETFNLADGVKTKSGELAGAYREQEAGVRAANEAQAEQKAALEGATPVLDAYQTQLERVADAQQTAADKAKAAEDAERSLSDARRGAADATFALKDAQDDFADTVQTLDQRVTAAGEDQEEVNRIYRNAAKDGIAVADATRLIAEQQAAKTGATLSAKDADALWTKTALEQAAALNGPARQALIDHIAQVNDIPESKATEIAAVLDQFGLAAAEEAIRLATLPREVPVKLKVTNTGAVTAILGPNSGLYSEGGFTGRGSKNEVAGIVHKGEYVVPADDVDQSTGLPKPAGDGMAAAAAGGSATKNYYLTVNAGIGAPGGQELGAAIVQAIKKFEGTNGPGWRAA